MKPKMAASSLSLYLEINGQNMFVTGSVRDVELNIECKKSEFGSYDWTPPRTTLRLELADDHQMLCVDGWAWWARFRQWLKTFPRP